MSFVYFNIQFTSFHKHAALHEYVGLLKHNKLNLPFVLGECQSLFTPSAMVQYSFNTLIGTVRTFDSERPWKFIECPNQSYMSI